MSQLAHISNIDFSTAFNTDKIVGIFRDSYALATSATLLGGYLYKYSFPHSFTRPVFCELSWSVNGTNYIDGGTSVGNGSQAAIAYSDASNIYILTTSNAGTLYYKVVATWIDNYDNTNPSITPVLNTTNNLYFDSRRSMPKIFLPGVAVINGVGSSSIAHPLGFAPRFKGYVEAFPGEVWPLIAGGNADIWLYDVVNQMECSALITNSQIELSYVGPASNRKLWYRIYANQ